VFYSLLLEILQQTLPELLPHAWSHAGQSWEHRVIKIPPALESVSQSDRAGTGEGGCGDKRRLSSSPARHSSSPSNFHSEGFGGTADLVIPLQ
jgi:hypothetical protein